MALVSYPEFLQTRTYSAQQLRHYLSRLGVQEGVYGATHFAVSQRGAGANMSVDVAAGDALIQGDDVTRQGIYHLVNDATVNAVVSAAHGSLPRIDQIIARVYDSTIAGVSDVPTIEVVAGTATSGATLDNRTGAAALPNGAIRLADVLVPAASATVVTANIRDRRPWANGAHAIGGGWASTSTTSNTGAVIDAASAKQRVEVSGLWLVRVKLRMQYYVQGTVQTVAFLRRLNGGAWTDDHYETPPAANNYVSGTDKISTLLSLSAGSYLVEAGVRNLTNTAQTIFWSTDPLVFEVEELVGHPNANNGTS